MTKTLIVDGNFLLKSSKVTLITNGYVGVVYTFLTTIRMLLTRYFINKVIVVWDGENSGKARFLIDESYKANRKTKEWHKKHIYTDKEIERMEREKKDEIFFKTRIMQYLEELFVRQIEIEYIEADDIVAFYCKEYSKNEEILILTNDRDYLQLIEYPNVKVWLHNLKKVITKENFNMYFKFHYKNVSNIKIICGDVSDNIKGVGGIKENTLFKFFPNYMTKPFKMNDLIDEAKNIQKQRLKENKKPLKVLDNLIFSKDTLTKNHKLIDLTNPLLKGFEQDYVRDIYSSVLNIHDRTSKNLIELMKEDKFLSLYNGQFIDYVKPFYGVINKEKELYNKAINNN